MKKNLVQRLVTKNSFDDTGTFRRPGEVGLFAETTIAHEAQKEKPSKHLKELDGYVAPVVEMAAVGPTGPNPTAPQQIPPDGYQGAGGAYMQPGKVLVGEVTVPEEERKAGITSPEDEADATDKLREALLEEGGNVDNNLVEGTVADIVATIDGSKSDEELAAMRAQEVDREKPRKGVLDKIDAELASRKENA
jgi:hypothetical protein